MREMKTRDALSRRAVLGARGSTAALRGGGHKRVRRHGVLDARGRGEDAPDEPAERCGRRRRLPGLLLMCSATVSSASSCPVAYAQ